MKVLGTQMCVYMYVYIFTYIKNAKLNHVCMLPAKLNPD